MYDGTDLGKNFPRPSLERVEGWRKYRHAANDAERIIAAERERCRDILYQFGLELDHQAKVMEYSPETSRRLKEKAAGVWEAWGRLRG